MTTPFEFRPILFAVFWKSGIALGAALCISRMLRNRSADLRRLVFSTTIVAMFAAAAAACAATLDSGDAALVPLPAPRARGCGRAIGEFADGRPCYGTNSAG